MDDIIFVVYLADHESGQQKLFATDVLRTATSFCDNFNNRIKELHDFRISIDVLDKDWKYTSGWNARIQKLTEDLNRACKSDRFTFDDVDLSVLRWYTFNWTQLKLI